MASSLVAVQVRARGYRSGCLSNGKPNRENMRSSLSGITAAGSWLLGGAEPTCNCWPHASKGRRTPG